MKMDIKQLILIGIYNPSFDSRKPKIFRCSLIAEFNDSKVINDTEIWKGDLDLCELEKVWKVCANKTAALLMMKDDSVHIAKLASVLTLNFDSWEINLKGDALFHDFVNGRNALIDFMTDKFKKISDLPGLENEKTQVGDPVTKSD